MRMSLTDFPRLLSVHLLMYFNVPVASLWRDVLIPLNYCSPRRETDNLAGIQVCFTIQELACYMYEVHLCTETNYASSVRD